ncbi:MAG: transcriptional repressor [Lentisphaeria bacterium]|nr:transcriptional repressor [Lentisphaeria bacterium]
MSAQRNTLQKKAIQGVFRQHDRPLRVGEVLEYGRLEVASLNSATVYRNLDRLVKEGWLTRINHPELGTLHEKSGQGHHHHFYCRSCDKLFYLSGCCLQEDAACVPEGFVPEHHEVFVQGVCPSCNDADSEDEGQKGSAG